MKKIIFRYFDIFYFGELSDNGDNTKLLKPVDCDSCFGYRDGGLYCNGNSFATVNRIFSIGEREYKLYLKEWFEQKYQLIVDKIY